ncbi:MAG: hypothetical protein HKN35_02495 [Woeseia sp.]|nr:hypothetical protein [Woeseia sp.]
MSPPATQNNSHSSNRFGVRLKLEPVRRLLLIPCAAVAIGALIIVHAPAPAELRAPALALWLAFEGHEIYSFARNAGQIDALWFSGPDRIRGRLSPGQWLDLKIQLGSVVRSRYLWLRLATGDGTRCDILLLRASLSAQDWRRLQVLLRFRA